MFLASFADLLIGSPEWTAQRPIRLAHDWGLIDYDEYERRRWERDYEGLPEKCYRPLD